jgi:3-oxoacyl-[acyl-carrier-protein] synthase-3
VAERYIARPDESLAQLAATAGEHALAQAGLRPNTIDLVIVATFTPDRPVPTTACTVQHLLGISNAAAFDLNAACSGFVYGLEVAHALIQAGAHRRVLLIGADMVSRFVNWNDRNTCVLFGDGAGAAVVRAVPEGRGVLGFDLGSDGGGGDLLKAEINTHLFLGTSFTAGKGTATAEEPCSKSYIAMDGKEVYRFAVNVMGESAVRALDRCGITTDDIDLFVPHQANVRIIDAAAKRLGVPSDRVFVNVGKYGNTSAASIPIALCEARDTGRIASGSTVVIVGFGAGLTWGSCVMRWV